MSEMRKFTPTELLQLLGWTDVKAGEMLGYSPVTIRRKKKSGKWSLADLKILTFAANVPSEYVAF